MNPSNLQLENTVKYIEELAPKKLHAAHCTDLRSKIALSRIADIEEVGVGLRLEYV
ncbi:UNVERIFIED_ORG: metal-dependent hydrolase (beta-lactamase superfamily II) [Bacillus sp. 1751]|uniref:hypothetical protein n=1 Tax=Priestia megaterium TaxID=1404 RepID=UPI0020D26D78|nr:hypothetical protein [Priestia megaterium]MDP9580532.1 metal-dependent hydrolase (beta-lactamase superfamily II) [Bacillus sp. 1751]